MTKQRIHFLLAAIIALLSLAAYLPAIGNHFVNWDDDRIVYDNPYIRSINWSFFKWAFSGILLTGYWNPLVWISHATDYALWKSDPAGHHFTNIVLHAANTFLVVLLVIKLFKAALYSSANPSGVTGSGVLPLLGDRAVLITAGMTGALFGLHPIHVESVAWVSERKDLLCALFFLLSIRSYIAFAIDRADVAGGNRTTTFLRSRQYLLSLAFFVLALASKAMAVTLPFVLLLVDWHPLRRLTRQNFIAVFIEKIPFMAFSALISVVTVVAQQAIGTVRTLDTISLSTRALVAVKSLIMYLFKMAMPGDLLPFYPYDRGISFFSIEYLSLIALVITITVLSMVIAKRYRLWLSVWGYYAVTLLPVLGLVKVGEYSMADRFTYLPSLGPFLLVGLATAWAWEKTDSLAKRGLIAKNAIAILAIVTCLIMTYGTLKQIAIWKNSIVFWSYVIEKVPHRVPVAYNNRAIAFMESGQFDRALEDYTTAIDLDSASPGAYNNRGVAYQEIGQFDRAIKDHTKAITLKPDSPDSYKNRGLAFKEIGQLDRAMGDFNKAIALDPGYADAYTSRGMAYKVMGRTELAMENYDKAISLDPMRSISYNNRGALFLEMRQLDLAIKDFTTAIKLNPKAAQTYTSRGLAFEQKGRVERALEDYTSAINVNPGFANAYNNRGLILERMGQFDQALEDFNNAVRLDPSSVEALYNRGLVLEDMGKFDLAVADYSKAIGLNPDDYLSYGSRGVAFRKLGQVDKAVADLSRAISLNPGFAQAYLDRGNCFREKGRNALAKKDYQESCRLGIKVGCDAVRAYTVPGAGNP
jgi:protein O-mannosyl-transferase